MIRVCHILSGDLWAGAEVMAYHLLNGLRAHRDLSLFVILLNRGKLADEVGKLGISHAVVEENKLPFHRIFFQVKKLLRVNSANIIHSHGYKENFLAYLCADGSGRTRLVSTQHGMPELCRRAASFKHRLMMTLNFFLLAHSFHKVVAVSRDIKRTLLEGWKVREKSIEAIPNGIPIGTRRVNHQRNGFVIGSCGRLVPVKDFPLMVKIAREVATRSDVIRFELAGDGPERDTIRELIYEYGLENRFHLRGFIEDMASFYAGLDLYVNTSFHEGIPMSVLEAMAHSIPVVAPDVGGLSEIVDDGVEGYLIDEREPKLFAHKCITLFSNSGLRAKMAEATRRRACSDFSIEQMVRMYYHLYRNEVNVTTELHVKNGSSAR